VSDKNTNRTNRLENRAGQQHDASARVLPAHDRYGYMCATLLGMDVPEALERKFKAWQAIQRKQGNTFGRNIPSAARDRLIHNPTRVSDEEGARIEASMRERAEETIAKYARA
jgi:hypothetical protein